MSLSQPSTRVVMPGLPFPYHMSLASLSTVSSSISPRLKVLQLIRIAKHQSRPRLRVCHRCCNGDCSSRDCTAYRSSGQSSALLGRHAEWRCKGMGDGNFLGFWGGGFLVAPPPPVVGGGVLR